ncbi:MAG: hypothetical protein A3E78_07705 [Alphaproteobacteria bacterium RIFCSPHIGHO2_12_FULL_63_12]|nr:MAG: hypothetical protein A3E78_07705 [Alphaproteobacteria bacterium RIFCSPHIGHO2_12_FULL_63_12]
MIWTQAGASDFLARFFGPEIDAWNGRQKLPTVFWGYGVAASLGLIAMFAEALQRRHALFEEALIAVSAAYTVWILVSIWRCSRPLISFSSKIARGLTVAWAINAAMVLAFLQLDLLARVLRG